MEKVNLNIESNPNNLGTMITNSFQKYSMYYVLVMLLALFQMLTDGILLTPINITNIILQNSYILILAIGMLLLIILGDIDLSVGSIAAFTGAMSAIFSIRMGLPTVVSIALCLLIGAAIGAFNGYWISYVKVPAFIATLASQLIFRGLTIVVLDGKSLAPYPDSFRIIASGFLPDIFNGSSLNIFSLVVGLLIALYFTWSSYKSRKNKISRGRSVESSIVFITKTVAVVFVFGVFTLIMASYEGFPNVLIILAILITVYRFVTNKTVVGRQVYATGGNSKAAALSGIKTQKIKFFMFMNMGVLSAIAGLVFSARLNAATATAGNGFELDAIAACYIGGASAYGGVGTIIGAIIGGLVMGVLNNGMSLMGIGVDWQQAIKGAVLLAAVAFDIYNKREKN